ncbi:AAA family ATPase [bacterium]|nr:AAA family ATPase [bacterium]
MNPLPPVVRAMLEPGFYPAPPASVELRQTHISYVLLAGDQVYKLKKPVRFAFLDFSTLARRRHFCAEEVRLNRRLADDVYRGVLAIVPRDGGFALAPADAADAVEYAVHMRRLPEARVLASLLDAGGADAALIDRIAARLAAFHAAAETSPAIARGGDPAEIARLMDEDFAEVAALHGDTISADDDAAIQGWCHARLAALAPLLRRRQVSGRIRDGHGDLHAEHVYCLESGELVIVDCIEFNPAFRRRDVAADLAFLAMDLACHGRDDLAARLVASYAGQTDDPELPALIPFYACQRAYIRGKVDSLKSREAEVAPADAAAARASAVRHFALALRYTWGDAPPLVVVCGLSGSGKSTVAAALAARTGFVHLNSDRTRKALAGLAPTERGGPELYTPERSAATYAALHDGAGAALAAGRGAIIDATFQRREHRDRAAAVARAAGAPLLFVECRADDAETRRRLARRGARADDPSDADWAVYQRQRATYEPLADDEPHLTIDTSRPAAAVLAEIEAALRRALATPRPRADQ